MRTGIGIDRMAVYSPQYALPLAALAATRGVAPEKYTQGLGVHEMAIAAPCEDVVTMAASAGARVLHAADVDPRSIGMLLVATETAVDHAKPVSIFVHDLLGIGSQCRVYELKHACYAGTAALMTAVDWVRAGGRRPRRALVIAADIARYGLGTAGVPTQGAGAVAMLVASDPRALVLDGESGTHADNVYDFWRPLGRREALVDGKYSIDCYLEALAGAYGAWRTLDGGNGPASARVARLLYHSPFPKMAHKAHRRLLELDHGGAVDDALAAASFADLVAPGLRDITRVGNCYTASLYLCLAGLLEREASGLAGRSLGLFSYGSGSCAEFFTGAVPAGVAEVADAGVARLLARRTTIDVERYEGLIRDAEAGGEPPADFIGDFVFRGIDQDRRQYGRPRAMAA